MGTQRANRRWMVATLAALACGLAAPAVEAAPPPVWTQAAPLSVDRATHAAMLLPDGDVFVAGGNASSATSERYDPDTDSWSPAPAMSVARFGLAATELADGRLLVTGGGNVGGGLASAEIYDPAADAWAPAADMSVPRRNHTLVTLSDGRVLAIGGQSGLEVAIAGTEVYDPATDVWTPTGSLAVPRADLTATLLPDGTVLALGGFNTSGTLATADRYDPATGGWTPAAAMAVPRSRHSATLLPDGTVLAVGTGTAERYHPADDAWTVAGDLASNPFSHEATALPGGSVLVTGAETSEVFDPTTGSWLSAGRIGESRRDHSATLLRDGTVLVVGGDGGPGSSVEREVLRLQLVTATSAPAIDFGDQSLNRTATALVPVRNDGLAPLVATDAAIEGPAAADYAVRDNGCGTRGAVGVRETCLVLVAFTPGASGARAATLVLRDNTVDGRTEVSLTGTGVAMAEPTGPAERPDESTRRLARTPLLRCVTGQASRVVCSGLARTTPRGAPARLVRHGKVFAVGRIDAAGKLRLKAKRPLLQRRYSLRIGPTAKTRMVVLVVSVSR
jgi:Galactose oxidase, central domain/Kelch motif